MHGGDFAILADKDGQAYTEQLLTAKYDPTSGGGIGEPSKSGSEVLVLNRVLRFVVDANG